MSPGAPGPAPTSQMLPAAKGGNGSWSRRANPAMPTSLSSRPEVACSDAYAKFKSKIVAASATWTIQVRHGQLHSEAAWPITSRMDDRRLRSGGNQGGVHGIGDGKTTIERGNNTPPRGTRYVSDRVLHARREFRPGRCDQGRRR